jgi:hypothetical protein
MEGLGRWSSLGDGEHEEIGRWRDLSLRYSVTPLLRYSVAQLLRYPVTPLLRYSVTPPISPKAPLYQLKSRIP